MKKTKFESMRLPSFIVLMFVVSIITSHSLFLSAHASDTKKDADQSHIKNRVKIVPKYGEGVKKIDYEEVKKRMERVNLTPEQLKALEEKEAAEEEKKRLEEENKKITDGNLSEQKSKEELAALKPPYSMEDLEKFRESVDTTAQAKEISIKVLEKEHEDVLELAKFNNYTGGDRVTAIIRNKKKNIDPVISKAKLDDEKRSLEYHKSSAKTELEKKVSDLETAKAEKKYLEEKLSYVQMLYDADKLKLSLGKLTGIELLESENALEEAKDAVKKVEDSIFRLNNELRRMIGFEIEKPLEWNYSLNLKEEIPVHLTERIASAVLRQPELVEKEQKRNYTKLIFDDVRSFYKNYDKEYIQAEADYKIALMEYNDVYNSLLIEIQSDLKKLASQKEFYRLALENKNLVEKVLSHKKMQFDLGRLSALELEKAKVDLSGSKLNVLKELVKYNHQRDLLYLKLEFFYQ